MPSIGRSGDVFITMRTVNIVFPFTALHDRFANVPRAKVFICDDRMQPLQYHQPSLGQQ